MDLEEKRQPRFVLTVDSQEAIALRESLKARLADTTITNKEKRLSEPMLQALIQLQLGDL